MLLFFLLTFSYLNSIVIIVHGTFSHNEDWHRLGGDFYEELQKQAQEIGHSVKTFLWSGNLSDRARIDAAIELAKLIIHYEDEEIIVVGHSHGGNVINFASRLLFDPIEYAMNEEEANTHFMENFFNELDMKKSFTSDDCLSDENEDKDGLAEYALDAWKEVQKEKNMCDCRSTCSIDLNEETDDKKNIYKIKKAYLLATPVDVMNYAPDMQTIEHVCN